MAKAVRDLNFAVPSQNDSTLHHKVKYFEEDTFALLETAVNDFIVALMHPDEQPFYINSIDYQTYVTDPPLPVTKFTCQLWFTVMRGGAAP